MHAWMDVMLHVFCSETCSVMKLFITCVYVVPPGGHSLLVVIINTINSNFIHAANFAIFVTIGNLILIGSLSFL